MKASPRSFSTLAYVHEGVLQVPASKFCSSTPNAAWAGDAETATPAVEIAAVAKIAHTKFATSADGQMRAPDMLSHLL